MGAMHSTDNKTTTEKEKRYLLELARKTIAYFLKTGKHLDLEPNEVPTKRLTEDGACFVTLYIGKNLRGCIGSLEATRPLVMDVIDNALNAAFGDPRFLPLDKDELKQVRISISILTKPTVLAVKDTDDLLAKLTPHKHGLILRQGYNSATYLPSVWEEIENKEEFLSSLCMKAGLPNNAWKDTKRMKFYIYEANEISE